MRAIYAVGWGSVAPPRGEFAVRSLPAARWREALAPRRGGSLLVLGRGALDLLDAAVVGEHLRPPYALAVALAGDAGGPAEREEWARAGVALAEGREALAREIARLSRVEARVPLEPPAWLPAGSRPGPRRNRTQLRADYRRGTQPGRLRRGHDGGSNGLRVDGRRSS